MDNRQAAFEKSFLKKILWNGKKVVTLHADYCGGVRKDEGK